MEYIKALAQFDALKSAHDYTEKTLANLRQDIGLIFDQSPHKDKVTVVTVGSFGRMEASPESDLDLYLLFNSDRSAESMIPDEIAALREAINKHIAKPPGDTGTFGSDVDVKFKDMLANIGGAKDSNELMTRRLLFLLEGTWLYGQEGFDQYRSELLGKYVKENDSEERIPKFLLNDIIRYYRTITTDFEQKVTEDNKPWGIRQVKLRFSRKILYFGGIIAVAESAHAANAPKQAQLKQWFDYPGLERLYQAAPNQERVKEVMALYNDFMRVISDAEQRKELESLAREDRASSDLYQELKGKADNLSAQLDTWLKEKYCPNHEIHHALIF